MVYPKACDACRQPRGPLIIRVAISGIDMNDKGHPCPAAYLCSDCRDTLTVKQVIAITIRLATEEIESQSQWASIPPQHRVKAEHVTCDVCTAPALDGWAGTVAHVDPCGCTVRVCGKHGTDWSVDHWSIDHLHAKKCPKRSLP